jgi:hypothetical protein
MALAAELGVQILGAAKGVIRREHGQHRIALAGDAVARPETTAGGRRPRRGAGRLPAARGRVQ